MQTLNFHFLNLWKQPSSNAHWLVVTSNDDDDFFRAGLVPLMKHRFKPISNKLKVVLTFILGLYLCKTAVIHHFALNWTTTSGKAPPRVFDNSPPMFWCYGRGSFRASNDDCFGRISLCWLLVGHDFERFDSDLVWANLTFPWSALNSISLCRLLNHAFAFFIMLEHVCLAFDAELISGMKDNFWKPMGRSIAF